MKVTGNVLWLAVHCAGVALAAGLGFWLRPVSYFNAMMYLRERISQASRAARLRLAGIACTTMPRGLRDGPVVVLVHGLGGRAEDWRNLAPYLAKAGFRVYMPDLPGIGRSEKPADFSYSVRDEAAVVVGFLDALGLKQVDLGGWSMGGWIVQHVAAEHPDRVRRLMLFDSAGLYEKPNGIRTCLRRRRRGTRPTGCAADAASAPVAGLHCTGHSARLAGSTRG